MLKVRVIISTILAFLTVLICIFFPDYAYVNIVLYALFVLFLCKKDTIGIINVLVVGLPYVFFHIIPLIINNFIYEFLNDNNLFDFNQLKSYSILTTIAISLLLYVKIYKVFGLLNVLSLFVIVVFGFKSWGIQLFVAGVVFLFFSTFFSFPPKNGAFKNFRLVYLPFFFFYTLNPIWEPILMGNSFDIFRLYLLPINLIVPLVIILGIFLKSFSFYNKMFILIVIFCLLFVSGFAVYPTWKTFIQTDKSIKEVSNLTLVNSKLDTVTVCVKSNSVNVIYLWSTSCGTCIKELSSVKELFVRYENDSLVNVFSVNIPALFEDKTKIEKYLDGLGIPCYYGDSTIVRSLNVSYFPTMIIVKGGIVYYKGVPEFKRNNYYSCYRLINRLKIDQ